MHICYHRVVLTPSAPVVDCACHSLHKTSRSFHVHVNTSDY